MVRKTSWLWSGVVVSKPMIIKVTSISGEKLQTSTSEELLSGNEPLLFLGGCKNWRAFGVWTPEYFERNFGGVEVPVSRYNVLGPQPESKQERLTLSQVLETWKLDSDQRDPEDDLYVAGWHFVSTAPSLMDDLEIPPLFSDNLLPDVNDKVLKYDWQSIFIGDARAHTPVHTDSFYVAVWLALITGTKFIRYVSNDHHEAMSHRPDLFDEDEVEFLQQLGVDVYQSCVQAGDIAYHPPGWWHQVKNLSFNVAISNNYVPPMFYFPFEQQLVSKAVVPILSRIATLRENLGNVDVENTEASRAAIGSSRYFYRATKLNLLIENFMRGLPKRNENVKD